ncbi:MAG: ribose-phosphate pyrophosphokinase [Halanaerobiales bacterium]
MSSENNKKLPFGELGIISLKSCRKLGKKIDSHLRDIRKSMSSNNNKYLIKETKNTYSIKFSNPRFSNGEAKITLHETARGKDVYIIVDIGNYGCTYEMFGIETHMGPDEHYQDIKRAISAIKGNARRVSVIMPMLYASRQHKRKGRESLDCSLALQELEALGVDHIITFDAHDPRVENAVPSSFENLYPTHEMIETIYETEQDLVIDKSSMMVISPDTGAMDRAIYYANNMGLNVGLFYKRRDHTKIINGKNPIIKHEYMGEDIDGKDVLIVDDMIASGESIMDLAKELKRRKAGDIYVAVTFALFTEGIDKIKEFHKEGLIKNLYSTNLTYIPPDVKEAEWFTEVDMSKFLAVLIHRLNYDEPISPLFNAEQKIEDFLEE